MIVKKKGKTLNRMVGGSAPKAPKIGGPDSGSPKSFVSKYKGTEAGIGADKAKRTGKKIFKYGAYALGTAAAALPVIAPAIAAKVGSNLVKTVAQAPGRILAKTYHGIKKKFAESAVRKSLGYVPSKYENQSKKLAEKIAKHSLTNLTGNKLATFQTKKLKYEDQKVALNEKMRKKLSGERNPKTGFAGLLSKVGIGKQSNYSKVQNDFKKIAETKKQNGTPKSMNEIMTELKTKKSTNYNAKRTSNSKVVKATASLEAAKQKATNLKIINTKTLTDARTQLANSLKKKEALEIAIKAGTLEKDKTKEQQLQDYKNTLKQIKTNQEALQTEQKAYNISDKKYRSAQANIIKKERNLTKAMPETAQQQINKLARRTKSYNNAKLIDPKTLQSYKNIDIYKKGGIKDAFLGVGKSIYNAGKSVGQLAVSPISASVTGSKSLGSKIGTAFADRITKMDDYLSKKGGILGSSKQKVEKALFDIKGDYETTTEEIATKTAEIAAISSSTDTAENKQKQLVLLEKEKRGLEEKQNKLTGRLTKFERFLTEKQPSLEGISQKAQQSYLNSGKVKDDIFKAYQEATEELKKKPNDPEAQIKFDEIAKLRNLKFTQDSLGKEGVKNITTKRNEKLKTINDLQKAAEFLNETQV
jgi:hypothetical protein